MPLTKKQRELTDEIKNLLEHLKLSPDLSNVDKEFWTTHLELARNDLIKLAVLGRYLLIDQILNDFICRAFFNRFYPKLRRTAKFKVFNYYVLERLFLVQKTELVRALFQMPKRVFNNLLALNSLRNSLAHSFFPQDRRVKPTWKGKNIFSRVGYIEFINDISENSNFLLNKLFKYKPRKKKKTVRSV